MPKRDWNQTHRLQNHLSEAVGVRREKPKTEKDRMLGEQLHLEIRNRIRTKEKKKSADQRQQENQGNAVLCCIVKNREARIVQKFPENQINPYSGKLHEYKSQFPYIKYQFVLLSSASWSTGSFKEMSNKNFRKKIHF